MLFLIEEVVKDREEEKVDYYVKDHLEETLTSDEDLESQVLLRLGIKRVQKENTHYDIQN